MLLPRWAVSSSSSFSLNTSSSGPHSSSSSRQSQQNQSRQNLLLPIASYTAGGLEICGNYNRMRGCQNTDCKFSHSCNRKVGNRVCGKPHSGSTHSSSGADR